MCKVPEAKSAPRAHRRRASSTSTTTNAWRGKSLTSTAPPRPPARGGEPPCGVPDAPPSRRGAGADVVPPEYARAACKRFATTTKMQIISGPKQRLTLKLRFPCSCRPEDH